MEQVFAVATCVKAFVLGAQLDRFVTPQKAHGDSTQHGQVLLAVLFSHPVLVLVKRVSIAESPAIASRRVFTLLFMRRIPCPVWELVSFDSEHQGTPLFF